MSGRGGRLGSNLGIVELTIALHPGVRHRAQAYVHKIRSGIPALDQAMRTAGMAMGGPQGGRAELLAEAGPTGQGIAHAIR
ncbi:1-deoxy-D-xylulose-5-phosphate synthase N-terminal domain-containing protein [Nonomuraea sp. M3C6]|uniref:1-deoxy-D-xylulose-5-phosphate synthase N-terminal domain-containing protein n=1 Tax=Nonomuraea marmarensis TaxID=3351344 RepID=A0ABW7AC60_9ACTN